MTSTGTNESEGPVPLYRRIRDELKARIEAGGYQHGDRLPSEAELARAYNVSRITSRQALDLLSSEGLIVRRQGMGSFVAPAPVTQPLVRLTDFVEDMVQAGLRPQSRLLRCEESTVPAPEAEHLGLEPGTRVYLLDRLRLADGEPIAFDRSWLPPQYGKLLVGEDLENRTIYQILEATYGIPVVAGEYTIEAAIADESLTHLLRVPDGAPLLVFERTSFTTHSIPVYHQRRLYRADRVRYRLTLERTAPGQNAIQSFEPLFTGE